MNLNICPHEQRTVDRFNAAFNRPGLPAVLCPVDSETLEALAKISKLRGRPDLAIELRALIYRRDVPVDDLETVETMKS